MSVRSSSSSLSFLSKGNFSLGCFAFSFSSSSCFILSSMSLIGRFLRPCLIGSFLLELLPAYRLPLVILLTPPPIRLSSPRCEFGFRVYLDFSLTPYSVSSPRTTSPSLPVVLGYLIDASIVNPGFIGLFIWLPFKFALNKPLLYLTMRVTE